MRDEKNNDIRSDFMTSIKKQSENSSKNIQNNEIPTVSIYSSENISVFYQDFSTKLLIVTFNELGSTIKGDSYWGKGFFAKLGISSIGVMTPRPNWYPHGEMDEAIQAIKAVTAGRVVVTYGHSQGGYGAIRYSSDLTSSVTLAFCPQISIDPEEVRVFDRRFESYFDRQLGGGLAIEEKNIGRNVYVIFDPLNKNDSTHANLLSKIPGISLIIAPFTDHDTVRIMAETPAGKEIFSFLEKSTKISCNEIRNIIRLNRGVSKTYRQNRFNYLIKNLPRTESILRRYVITTDSEKNMMLATIDIKNKNLDAAKKHLDLVVDEYIIKIGILFLWTLFRKLGFIEGELRISNIISIHYGENKFYRLHRVNTFIRAGLLGEAREELLTIAKKFGVDQNENNMINFSNILGCYDQMIAASGAETSR